MSRRGSVLDKINRPPAKIVLIVCVRKRSEKILVALQCATKQASILCRVKQERMPSLNTGVRRELTSLRFIKY